MGFRELLTAAATSNFYLSSLSLCKSKKKATRKGKKENPVFDAQELTYVIEPMSKVSLSICSHQLYQCYKVIFVMPKKKAEIYILRIWQFNKTLNHLNEIMKRQKTWNFLVIPSLNCSLRKFPCGTWQTKSFFKSPQNSVTWLREKISFEEKEGPVISLLVWKPLHLICFIGYTT